jgi:predicted kinase
MTIGEHIYTKSKPKVLVLAGGAGAGKSYFVRQLGKLPIQVIDSDKHLDAGDPPNVAVAKADKEVASAMSTRKSFVWDTTASNPDKIKELIRKGYDVMMVMVYTHPLVALESNFSRDRKVPKIGVFSTWQKVYKLIDTYKDLLGQNFILVHNNRPEFNDRVQIFNKAARGGILNEFISAYTDQEPERYRSTYSKPFALSPVQEVQFQRMLSQSNVDKKDEKALKELRKDFDKMNHLYEKQGFDRLNVRYKSILNSRAKTDSEAKQTVDEIATMVQDEVAATAIPFNTAVPIAWKFFGYS